MLRRLVNVILNFTFIGILSATVSGSAFAEPDKQSANYWMPFCRQAATGNYYNQGGRFYEGLLRGIDQWPVRSRWRVPTCWCHSGASPSCGRSIH